MSDSREWVAAIEAERDAMASERDSWRDRAEDLLEKRDAGYGIEQHLEQQLAIAQTENAALRARVAELEGRLRLLMGHESGWVGGLRAEGAAAERVAIVADIRRFHPNTLHYVNTRTGERQTYADRIESGAHLTEKEGG